MATRISDSERSRRIALLSVDLGSRIITAVKPIANMDVESGEVNLETTVVPTRSLERFIDVSIFELHLEDMGLLIALQTNLHGFNAMFLKMPIGSADSSVIPSLKGYRKLAEQTLGVIAKCKKLLEHINQHPRPEPGEMLPSSGLLSRSDADDAS